MAVEDEPLFPKWKKRLEDLIAVTRAFREGNATQADVDKAQAEYEKISSEI